MDVHVVDGTYELFRHFFVVPSHRSAEGLEIAATRAVVRSILGMLEGGATHVGVASDHVIESFRNALWPGYKTGAGIDPALSGQFALLEEALRALGVAVWPMIEHEADDAMASAAARARDDARVARVYLCTPDKDLAQCVVGDRVVQLNRRTRVVRDEAGVRARFGVGPASIPDLLALVGDAADGFPGLPGWGAKSAAKVLDRYGSIEQIPEAGEEWDVRVAGRRTLAATLVANRAHAMLFKDLATLRDALDVGSVDEWWWRGPAEELERWCGWADAPDVAERAQTLARTRWG